MTQEINLSDNQWEELKKIVYGCSIEYLQNALNTARRQTQGKQMTKRAGKEIAHWMLAELVYHQIRLTNLCDDGGLNIWIDNKGTFKIKLSTKLLGPEAGQ